MNENASGTELKIVAHNVASLFAGPDVSSEQVSQLTANARVRVLRHDDARGMAFVEGEDRYKGWMLGKFLTEPQDFSDNPHTTIAALFADVHSSPTHEAQIVTKLTVATKIALGRHSSDRDFTPLLLPDGATGYTHRANLSSTYQRSLESSELDRVPSATQTIDRPVMIWQVLQMIMASSLRLIGTPYVWGGTTPFGIDCSGLTQLAYKIGGVQLLRDASLQINDRRFVVAAEGTEMANAQLEASDLLFFRSRKAGSGNVIGHVGLAIGDGSFIHAAGGGMGVIVTPCDDPRWGGLYVGARRLSANADFSIEAA